jgi:hypothetical protein
MNNAEILNGKRGIQNAAILSYMSKHYKNATCNIPEPVL